MNKNDFFSETDVKNFSNITRRFDNQVAEMFTDKYIKAVIAKLRQNKNYILELPDVFQKIPDKMKTFDMCKLAINYNFTNIAHVPKSIQNSDEFFEYIWQEFFVPRKRLSMIHKYVLYNVCDDLFYNIKALIDLKGME